MNRQHSVLAMPRRRGIALIFVIMVLLILIVIASAFVAFTSSDLKAADESMEATTCYYMAESGIDYGVFLITHNMAIYPSNVLGVTYNVDPRAITPGANGSGGLGSCINLTAGTESVVVSNLSYTSATNWLGVYHFVGTFKVKQNASQPSPGQVQYVLQSTGYIKYDPNAIDNFTNFLTAGTYIVRAQRTVMARVQCSYTFTATGATSDYGKDDMQVENYYEQYR